MPCKQALAALTVTICLVLSSMAQEATTATSDSVVPMFTRFSGNLKEADGRPITTITGVTFLLYKDPDGGAPVWIETQNVHPDSYGRYTVTLGATAARGLPTDLFASGEARWLGVQISGQGESARTLLVSVPYALKAQDAATIGGLPPSAFVLANPSTGTAIPSPLVNLSLNPAAAASPTAITGTGSVNFVPLWNSTSDIISSVLFQSGTRAAGKIGINTITPASTLDVNGAATVRGTFSLPSVNGWLGVGTMSPTALVDIEGSTAADTLTAPNALVVNGGTGGFGNGYTAGNGASIVVNAGNGGANGPGVAFPGTGGSITLKSGSAGCGAGLVCGGTGGSIQITGATNHYADDQTGSSIVLTAGTSPSTAGSIVLSPGRFTGRVGTNGSVQLWNYTPAFFFEDSGNTVKGLVGPNRNGDLSLVSRTSGNWLRLGSNQGAIAFWTDGNAESNETAQMFLSTRALYVFGSCLGGNCSSDVRLKKNIRPLPPVLDKLAQLEPVSWDWRTEEYPDLHLTLGSNFGLIAQDVEKVFPELVSTDEHGFKAVNYSRFPLMLLEAAHELKAENDSLRAKLHEQETAIHDQQVQLMELAAQMRTLQAAFAANASSSKGPLMIARDGVRP